MPKGLDFRRAVRRVRWCSAALALLVALPVAAGAQVTLIPYGATGYRYEVTTATFPPVGSVVLPYGASGYCYAITTGDFPPGVELPSFDDSGYASGAAPFSNGTGPGIYTPTTYWPENTKLIARIRFTIAGAPRPTTLRFGVDNDATLFLNGTQVASVTHGGANYDDFALTIPEEVLQTGENLLVVLAVDRGGNTAFDVSLTTGVELPEFDDSGYAFGGAPFSNGTGPGIYTPTTFWPENTKLVVRRWFTVPGTPGIATLRFGVDNDATIFLNGTQIASVTHGGANYDDFIIPVPSGVLHAGDNLLVVLAVDRGGNTAFDVSLTAEGVTASSTTSWGGLKARYR